ncbi:hypothetical protein AMAG_04701 [Allomyces macrogynus ATCC 38327]|uniref:Uncharacterized protein n=1 Tax=Allomyces macrogynus (strain ATCC 38327) TaxID=578462 RepID=A0A0L0S607_ALLM3|nr:hypothetical protein AMAG_04701 [Allomyces macrogynus ATCC 38327]|eukprot:KNE57856.1 hypothetical protein AMAG_04701 [Allomyces macrogynus ATCC 38327]
MRCDAPATLTAPCVPGTGGSRPTTPQPAALPPRPASLSTTTSYHALWSINLSGQKLTHLGPPDPRSTTDDLALLPTGAAWTATSPYLPPVIGYLNLAHNRLGLGAVQAALRHVHAVLHLVLVGNPASLALGLPGLLDNPATGTHPASPPPTGAPPPPGHDHVAAWAALTPPHPRDARAIIVAALPRVWCIDHRFVTRAEEDAAMARVVAGVAGTVGPTPTQYTATLASGGPRSRVRGVALQVPDRDGASKWGCALLGAMPKSLDPHADGQWAQLHTLAADWDAEVAHLAMRGGDAAGRGAWVAQLVDRPEDTVLLWLTMAMLVDPRLPRELTRTCLLVVAQLAAVQPVDLANELVLALPVSVVLKLLTILLAVMDLEQAKSTTYDPSLLTALRRHTSYLTFTSTTDPPDPSSIPGDPTRRACRALPSLPWKRPPPPDRRATLELLMTCAATSSDALFLAYAPYLHGLAADPTRGSRVASAGVPVDPKVVARRAAEAAADRFAYLCVVEDAVANVRGEQEKEGGDVVGWSVVLQPQRSGDGSWTRD